MPGRFGKKCVEWGEETREQCAEYRDDGYNACSSWDSKCCTWWPCSWGCKLLTWFCVAWYWVSNLVCVAWTYVTVTVCVLWETVVTGVSFVVDLLGMVVGTLLSFIDFIIEVLFSIPFLGRFLKQLWSAILEAVWRIEGIFDALAWFLGIRPEKKLRLCVIILRDKDGLVADIDAVLRHIQTMIDIYYKDANVRVIPVSCFRITTPVNKRVAANEDFIHASDTENREEILDVHCGGAGYGEDYMLTGSEFNLLMSKMCFCGNSRRLIGYGAPITAFIVRSIHGSAVGCSLSVLTDYITVAVTEASTDTTMAHESGHACGLWDVDDDKNLMHKKDVPTARQLTSSQAMILRNSRHVTYF